MDRQQLLNSLGPDRWEVEPHHVAELLVTGARVYAYVLVDDDTTPQAVRVPTLAYLNERQQQGWKFVLFYRAAGTIPIRRA